jgi:bifunctional non-homologous end joining protein LigD
MEENVLRAGCGKQISLALAGILARLPVARECDGDRVRLITRGGYDWTKRYPWIVEAALKKRYKQFVIDGEAVVLGVDGYSDFSALHSGKHNDEMQLHAFDLLAFDGDDLRSLPLSMRKAHLERLLARRPDGIFISPFEQGEIGPDLFRKACEFGLEGLVSKRRDRLYRAGRSKDWIKVKNRKHPAMERVKNSVRAYVFRSALKLGHSSMRSACLRRAQERSCRRGFQ